MPGPPAWEPSAAQRADLLPRDPLSVLMSRRAVHCAAVQGRWRGQRVKTAACGKEWRAASEGLAGLLSLAHAAE
jgi:hypothetical protein